MAIANKNFICGIIVQHNLIKLYRRFRIKRDRFIPSLLRSVVYNLH